MNSKLQKLQNNGKSYHSTVCLCTQFKNTRFQASKCTQNRIKRLIKRLFQGEESHKRIENYLAGDSSQAVKSGTEESIA